MDDSRSNSPSCRRLKSEQSTPKRSLSKSSSSSSLSSKKGSGSRTPQSGKRKDLRSVRSAEKKRQDKDEDSLVMSRPKRAVAPKSFQEQSLGGIHWKEENELQRALYASLYNRRAPSVSTCTKSESDIANSSNNISLAATDSEASNSSYWQQGETTPDCKIVKTENLPAVTPEASGPSFSKSSVAESLLKAASLRAQRKFAQGSRPCSPCTTPVKSRPSVSSPSKLTACLDISNCRAKTEDFLTFLCLRGTNKLPAHLEHFNNPESDETSSYPSTPCPSQDGSRPGTPARGSRPATPSHAASRNGNHRAKSSKRESPDREILMENPELGVKPLVSSTPESSDQTTPRKRLQSPPARSIITPPVAPSAQVPPCSSISSNCNDTVLGNPSEPSPLQSHGSTHACSVLPHHTQPSSMPTSASHTAYTPSSKSTGIPAVSAVDIPACSTAASVTVCGPTSQVSLPSERSTAISSSIKEEVDHDWDAIKENFMNHHNFLSSISIPGQVTTTTVTTGVLATSDVEGPNCKETIPGEWDTIKENFMSHHNFLSKLEDSWKEESDLKPCVEVQPKIKALEDHNNNHSNPNSRTSCTSFRCSCLNLRTSCVTSTLPSYRPSPNAVAMALPKQSATEANLQILRGSRCETKRPMTMTTDIHTDPKIAFSYTPSVKPPLNQPPVASTNSPCHNSGVPRSRNLPPCTITWGRCPLHSSALYSFPSALSEHFHSAASSVPSEDSNKPQTKSPSRKPSVDSQSQSNKTTEAPHAENMKNSVRDDSSIFSKKLKKAKTINARILRSGSTQSTDDFIQMKKSKSPHSKRDSSNPGEDFVLKKAKRKSDSLLPETSPNKRKKEESPKKALRTLGSSPRGSKAEVAEADSTTPASRNRPKPATSTSVHEVIVIEDSPEPARNKPPQNPPSAPKSTRTPSPRKTASSGSAAKRSGPDTRQLSGGKRSRESTPGHIPTLSLSFRETFPAPNDLPRIVQVPTYHPSAEEFSDPISYISLIQPDAESYGICRIVPPEGWKPECKLSEELRFSTQVQHIHRLMNRWGPNAQQLKCIKKHLESQGNPMEYMPLVGGVELDMASLSNAISSCGGLQSVINKNKWAKVSEMLRIPKPAQEIQGRLYELYCRYLLSYDTLTAEEKSNLHDQVVAESQKQQKEGELEDDCITKGRSRTLSEFFRASRNMQAMWFKDGKDPSPPQVENEYWRLVEGGKHHVSVQSGSQETHGSCSAFPTRKDSPYSRHGWNFNMLHYNAENVLRHAGHISGVTVPMLYISMLFSSQCWYRNPHFLPQIHYLHSGSDTVWYCIPKSEASKLKTVMADTVPDLVLAGSQDFWLPPDTVMLSPSLLVEKGLSLCRAIQQANEFVVIFPESFSASISCGYNIAESVHFASSDWLSQGWHAHELLHDCDEPELISMEKIAFKLARSERTDNNTLNELLPHLNAIISQEKKWRQQLADVKKERLTNHNKCLASVNGKRRGHSGWVGGASTADDQFHCCVCNKICFLAMVVNENEGQAYCLKDAVKHVQKKRNMKACTMLLRHPTKDLDEILSHVKSRLSTEDSALKRKGPKIKQASNT